MSPRQQRCALAAAIVGAHAVIVLLLVYTQHLLRQGGSAAEPRFLFVAEFPPPSPAAHTLPGPSGRRLSPGYAGSTSASTAQSQSAPITLAQNPERIDWDLEAEIAADDWVSDLARHEKRKCDDSDKPGSWLPKCRKHRSSFEWSSEPKRAGFVNGLPYLRLGKRCILVLGMVGCAMGPAPPPNGHLFGDLRDPDRDRSSVPDIATINEPVDMAPRYPSLVIDPAAPTLTPGH